VIVDLITPNSPLHPFRRIGVEPLHYVAVEIQRDPHRRVAQSLARDFRMHTGSQHHRGGEVPQVVKPYALIHVGSLKSQLEVPLHVPGLERRAGARREHQIVPSVVLARSSAAFHLKRVLRRERRFQGLDLNTTKARKEAGP
jgi:hypothetical protein